MYITRSNTTHLKLGINGKMRQTPIFIPSISSARMEYITYNELLDFVLELDPPNLLYSAYDLTLKKVPRINNSLESSFVMLDSGGYELKNTKETKEWTFDNYLQYIRYTRSDIIASFDHPACSLENQIRYYQELVEYSDLGDRVVEFIIPGQSANRILEDLIHILNRINPTIIGIPDYYLGQSLSQQIHTLKQIVQIIVQYSPESLLHILGVGDPELIRIFYTLGATIFDSTKWYRRILNKVEGYWCFVSELICSCKMCQAFSDKASYFRIITHNIYMYQQFMEELRYEIQGE